MRHDDDKVWMMPFETRKGVEYIDPRRIRYVEGRCKGDGSWKTIIGFLTAYNYTYRLVTTEHPEEVAARVAAATSGELVP